MLNAVLSDAELARITGHLQRAKQVDWLRTNRWVFQLNAKGDIVVGRWYAEMRLAGLRPETSDGPNLAAIR